MAPMSVVPEVVGKLGGGLQLEPEVGLQEQVLEGEGGSAGSGSPPIVVRLRDPGTCHIGLKVY